MLLLVTYLSICDLMCPDSAVRVALEITEGHVKTLLCSRQKVGGFHSLSRYESFMLREAHLCTQNTTSIAVMLHFATFMFWLERRPFSCQCTFPRTQRGEEHATKAEGLHK